MIKKIILAMFTLLSFSVISHKVSADSIDDLNSKIEHANKIELEQNFFAFSTSYDIIIKGDVVGTLTGDFYHPFGDTLKIKTLDDKTTYSEIQQSRWMNMSINRGGVFKDRNNKQIGAIKEVPFQLFSHQFNIYNEKGNKVGSSYKDPFHLASNHYLIKNKSGGTVFKGVTDSFRINKTIDIKRIKKSKDVTMKKALIIMAIEEAIEEKDKDDD